MNIFISANNTNQGKTHSTLLLMEKCAKLGYKIAAMKPIETGVEDIPQDGKKLYEKARKLNPLLQEISLNDVVPITHKLPAAPYVAGNSDIKKIFKAYKKIKPLCDILFIEGAGGICVPINDNLKMFDFIKMFNAKLFMVFGSKLGMINDFLLNKNFLENNNINFHWAINLFNEEEYFSISHPYMKKYNPLFIQKDLDTIIKNLLKDKE